MMFASKCLPLLFLAALVSPQTVDIEVELTSLLTFLSAVDTEITGVFGITDPRCPCSDDTPLLGNETFEDVGCYEAKVNVFRNNVRATIAFVQGLQGDSVAECPERTGALLVASCDSPGISVIDPNGLVQNGFDVTVNISGWTLGPSTDESFEYDYFINNPFEVRCRIVPSGVEIILANSSDAPLTSSAVGTGIAYFEPTDEVFVAITFPDSAAENGIYAFNRTGYPDVRLAFPYSGQTGSIEISGDYVYMISGQNIVRIKEGETNWTIVAVTSVSPLAFAVQDGGEVLFCEASGALYQFVAPCTFVQLRQPAPGPPCSSIELGPDGTTVYYATQDSTTIEVFNASAPLASPETLEIASNSSCPILLLDPRSTVDNKCGTLLWKATDSSFFIFQRVIGVKSFQKGEIGQD